MSTPAVARSAHLAKWVPLLLLAVLALSIALAPARLPRFVLGFAYRGPLVDLPRWRRWVEANPDLFGPLGETARFAIAESPNDSTALVLTRTRDGLSVEKTHFLLFRDVPVMLAMSPATAEELFLLHQRQGDRFWDAMKFLVQQRRIVAWVFAPRRELDRVGLTGFLQVIDAIPPERSLRDDPSAISERIAAANPEGSSPSGSGDTPTGFRQGARGARSGRPLPAPAAARRASRTRALRAAPGSG